MKYIALAILLLAATTFADLPEEDDVIVLSKDNFDEALEKFDYIMVEFYAPWCGHCKKLAPEYSKAAQSLKEQNVNNVALAKLDSTQNEELSNRFDIKGFPTLKFFSKAAGPTNPVNYEGAREAGEIAGWVLKKSGPPSTELKTAADVQAKVQNVGDQPFVVFFAQEDDKEFPTFENVARQVDRVQFFHTFDSSARETLGLGNDVRVGLFKNFDEKKNVFEQSFDEATLSNFIQVNSVPTLLPFNDKAIQAIFQQGSTAIFLFANDSEESNKAYDAFASVAGEFKDKVKFSFSKPNDGFGLFARLAEYVGADQNVLPNIMLMDPSNQSAKYKFEGEPTSDNIRQFVNDFLAGKLQRYLKSQEVPETNDEPVKIVVGKNFNELVTNNDKDVLVEFYAPWCGHCKQLEPIYNELAQKLSKNHNIVIAKCDSTQNEVPNVEIQSFPTIKFFKNGQKDQAVNYNGERSVEGFLTFLKENTSHSWVELSGEKSEDL